MRRRRGDGVRSRACIIDKTGHTTLRPPGGFDDAGLPIGFQLVAGRLREDVLVHAGIAYQGVTHWHERRPDV